MVHMSLRSSGSEPLMIHDAVARPAEYLITTDGTDRRFAAPRVALQPCGRTIFGFGGQTTVKRVSDNAR